MTLKSQLCSYSDSSEPDSENYTLNFRFKLQVTLRFKKK